MSAILFHHQFLHSENSTEQIRETFISDEFHILASLMEQQAHSRKFTGEMIVELTPLELEEASAC